MLWAVVAFAGVWFIGISCLGLSSVPVTDALPDALPGATRYGRIAMHILMAAYFAHLLARTVYLSARYRREVGCQGT